MTEPFDAKSTTHDVLAGVDLKGRRILVTGVSAGLGVETARALAAHGATVVGAARDLKKAETAAADKQNAAGEPFDVIIRNAGVMATPFGKTKDGFETQFGTTT